MCTNLSDMYEKSFVNLCQHRRIRQYVSKCANCSSGFQNKNVKSRRCHSLLAFAIVTYISYVLFCMGTRTASPRAGVFKPVLEDP